jgi:hypothetical protein
VILVDTDDLTAHAASDLSQFSLLVRCGLVRGRNSQIENGTFHEIPR